MMLVPPEALAEELGVESSTLVKWRYLGKGPKPTKVGRRVLYRREKIDEWLEQQTRFEYERR